MVVVAGAYGMPDHPHHPKVWQENFLSPTSQIEFGVVGVVWHAIPPPLPHHLKVKLSLGVVRGGGGGCLNITSTILGTFYIREDE